MKIHRFYINNAEFIDKLMLTKKEYPDLHNQMVNVLKLKKEEPVVLFNSYFDYTYIIKGIGSKESMLILKDKNENKIEQVLKSKTKINLYIANIKKDKLEWCIEKSVELGVSDIYLLESERTQKLNTKINSTPSSQERLSKIMTEAIEQCGRGELVKINETQSLKKVIGNITKTENNLNYACIVPKEEIQKSITLSAFQVPSPREGIKEKVCINIFIGPEGGWTESEEGLFLENKFNILNLGPTILRAETAAVCAISKFI